MVRKKEYDIFKMILDLGNKDDPRSLLREKLGILRNSAEDAMLEKIICNFRNIKKRKKRDKIQLTGKKVQKKYFTLITYSLTLT